MFRAARRGAPYDATHSSASFAGPMCRFILEIRCLPEDPSSCIALLQRSILTGNHVNGSTRSELAILSTFAVNHHVSAVPLVRLHVKTTLGDIVGRRWGQSRYNYITIGHMVWGGSSDGVRGVTFKRNGHRGPGWPEAGV